MIYTVFYYTFLCSAVLFYGVGLNRTTLVSGFRGVVGILSKSLVSIICTSLLSWIFIYYILSPLQLIDLFPFVALLIFLVVTVLFESIVRITVNKITSEFSLSYLIIILSLNESTSILEVLLINVSTMLAFLMVIPMVKVIKRRNAYVGNRSNHANARTLMLISLAVVIMSFAVYNISWLNQGVMK